MTVPFLFETAPAGDDDAYTHFGVDSFSGTSQESPSEPVLIGNAPLLKVNRSDFIQLTLDVKTIVLAK